MTIPSTRQRMLLGVAAGGLTALLAACGSSDNGSGGGTTTAPPPPQSGTSARQVTAELSDFHIKLSTERFTAGTYTFTAKNTGNHDHALVVQGPGGQNRSKTVSPGESTALTVTLKSGTYEVYCPIDGHKDLGMKTAVTVGGAPAPSTNKPSNNDQSPGSGY
ncbi:copper-binding protein [Streptomyces actuosus]|uniref:Copper-binding protein n=1 Tax=Streptomyces actuosus TaxID=1885 RepID=A0ABS2VWD5_STRAS|nr:plastocyanin/azurin family copper-binding protein [Streptomyces actuosus]MBN0047463.1 copper-binding protein [Streptomyces actuosus]